MLRVVASSPSLPAAGGEGRGEETRFLGCGFGSPTRGLLSPALSSIQNGREGDLTQRHIGFLSVALSGPIRFYPWSMLSVMPQSLPEILVSAPEIKSIEADTGGARGLVKQPLVNLDQIGCGLFWTKLR